jgi:hypothetical protein
MSELTKRLDGFDWKLREIPQQACTPQDKLIKDLALMVLELSKKVDKLEQRT